MKWLFLQWFTFYYWQTLRNKKRWNHIKTFHSDGEVNLPSAVTGAVSSGRITTMRLTKCWTSSTTSPPSLPVSSVWTLEQESETKGEGEGEVRLFGSQGFTSPFLHPAVYGGTASINFPCWPKKINTLPVSSSMRTARPPDVWEISNWTSTWKGAEPYNEMDLTLLDFFL